MKKYFKGFSIQLGINIVLHIIRMVVAYFIIKYAPEDPYTSFAKDSMWQLISLLSILGYNAIFVIVMTIKHIRKDIKLYFGFLTSSLLGIVYVLFF